MPAAPRPSEPTVSRRTAALMVIAVALGFLGHGLAGLTPDSALLAPPAAFVAEAQQHFLPTASTASTDLVREALALTHGWAHTAAALTGQWDARVLGALDLLLAAGGLALFIAQARRRVSPFAFSLLATSGLLLALLVPLGTRPLGGTALADLWWLLTLAQFSLAAPSAGPTRRALGLLCGLLNLAASTLGAATALALLVRDWRERATRPALAASAALAALGLASLLWRHGSGDGDFASLLGAALAYPFSAAPLALAAWAPALFVTGRWLAGRSASEPAAEWVGTLTLAWFGATVAAAAGGYPPAPAWLSLGVLLNLTALAALPAGDRRLSYGAAAWFVAATLALAQPFLLGTPGRTEPLAPAADAVAQPQFAALLKRPEIQRVLPTALRAPLPVQAEAGGGIFSAEIPPTLLPPDEQPRWSSWRGTTGEFHSGWLRTEATLLQVRIGGTLRPPETELVLATEDGRELAPLETNFTSENRWKRVNFAAPSGPFRLVARDRSASAWLAFSAPYEVSRTGWVAGKFVRTSPWWLGVSALAALVLVVLHLRAARDAVAARLAAIEWRVVPWLAVLAYGLFFWPHVDNTAGPNDAGGYLNLAKTFASGHVFGTARTLPLEEQAARDLTLYVPSTAQRTADNRMAPEYPPGLPLLIAAVALVLPFETAITATLWLHLVAAVAVMYFAGRVFGLSRGWAWLGALIIGLNSVFLFQTLQPQSDGPSLVWITLAVALAWGARERPSWAWGAGLACAVAVLMRPANVLCFFPVLAALFDRPKLLVRLALAGLPAALWLLWFNAQMYGSPFRTGYGDVSNWWAWRFVGPTLVAYAQWLPLMFTPAVVAAFASPWVKTLRARAQVVLWLWGGAFLVFYVSYWCTYSDWFNMRFVLPGMPALVLLGLHVVRAGLERDGREPFATTSPRSLWTAVALVVVATAFVLTDTVQRDVLYWARANRAHRVAVDWLREHQPGRAVVLAEHASNAVWHYSDFVLVRRKYLPADGAGFLARAEAAGFPVYAINQHWERDNFEWGRGKGDGLPNVPGRWERLAVLWEGEYVVWRWHPPVGRESVALPAPR